MKKKFKKKNYQKLRRLKSKQASAPKLIVSKIIWEHVFHRRRTLTLSLKAFDSALERMYSQLHMRVFVWLQVLRNIICSMLKHVI